MRFSKTFFVIFIGFILISCGHDEPVDPNEITRVQDGNGKVFLENGTLVDANLDYTQAELEQALQQYDWEREYSFYYDNRKISPKMEINAMPRIIHPDGTIEFDFSIEDARVRLYTISGKQITAIQNAPSWSSSMYPPVVLTVVSLDMTETSGRIVMDRKIDMELDGYSTSSLYVRMVWKARMTDS
jgi:hypothetical protein